MSPWKHMQKYIQESEAASASRKLFDQILNGGSKMNLDNTMILLCKAISFYDVSFSKYEIN